MIEPKENGKALFDLIERLTLKQLIQNEKRLFSLIALYSFFVSSITMFSMYDSSNPLIILFSADFIQALDCTSVHILDLPTFLQDRFSLIYPFKSLSRYPVIEATWAPLESFVPSAHKRFQTFKVEEYVHKLVKPTSELIELIRYRSSISSISFRSKKIKLLRLIRSVTRYAQENNLNLPGSYKNSIYCCDERLNACLDVRYFHVADLAFILYYKCVDSYRSSCA